MVSGRKTVAGDAEHACFVVIVKGTAAPCRARLCFRARFVARRVERNRELSASCVGEGRQAVKKGHNLTGRQ